ncbi:hypothetical protein TNCV_1644211 [Trichonephila clavipes]|nr:hypothetical protein TNCV_1644211 [Trichonephila clavipes]
MTVRFSSVKFPEERSNITIDGASIYLHLHNLGHLAVRASNPGHPVRSPVLKPLGYRRPYVNYTSGTCVLPQRYCCRCLVLPRGQEGKLLELEIGWTSRCTPAVGRSLEHHAGYSTRFNSVPLQLRGEHPGGSGAPYLSCPFTNLMSGLAARQLFRVPPCRKCTIHLQTSMSCIGFEPSPMAENRRFELDEKALHSENGCFVEGFLASLRFNKFKDTNYAEKEQ